MFVNLQKIYHNNIKKRNYKMAEYVFKMKKGEIEIELSSDDAEFVEQQLAKWREEILKKQG